MKITILTVRGKVPQKILDKLVKKGILYTQPKTQKVKHPAWMGKFTPENV